MWAPNPVEKYPSKRHSEERWMEKRSLWEYRVRQHKPRDTWHHWKLGDARRGSSVEPLEGSIALPTP